jgi:hypothetical protein
MRKGHRFVLLLLILGVSAATLSVAAMLVATRKKQVDTEEYLYSVLRDKGLLSGPDWSVAIYVRGVLGKTLLNPVVKWRDPDGEVRTVLMAREGELKLAGDSRTMVVCLRDGIGTSADGWRLDFQERSIEVPVPAGFGENE